MGITVVFNGVRVMVIAILLGIVLNFGILIPLTAIHDGLTKANIYDVPTDWDSREEVDFFITLTHMCVYLVPLLGILYFVVTTVKALRYDTQDEEMDYGAGSERW